MAVIHQKTKCFLIGEEREIREIGSPSGYREMSDTFVSFTHHNLMKTPRNLQLSWPTLLCLSFQMCCKRSHRLRDQVQTFLRLPSDTRVEEHLKHEYLFSLPICVILCFKRGWIYTINHCETCGYWKIINNGMVTVKLSASGCITPPIPSKIYMAKLLTRNTLTLNTNNASRCILRLVIVHTSKYHDILSQNPGQDLKLPKA